MKTDVLILGTGSAGEMLASLLAESGKSVLIIEEHLIGGECPFYSCMPSKAMLRSAAARFDAAHTVNVGATSVPLKLDGRANAYAAAVARREKISDNHSDLSNEKNLIEKGIKVVRGRGIISEPGKACVGEETFDYDHLVIATGSASVIPPIPGLEDIDFWTTDKALTSRELPNTLIVIGGGAAGCELAQIYSRFGTEVTIVEAGERLIGKEEEAVSRALGEMFQSEGITLLLGTGISSVEKSETGEATVVLEDGRKVSADKLLVATGRKPRTDDIGLELLGIELDDTGAIVTDQHCRAQGFENIWAGGDVNGVAPLTHTANYQARIIAAGILGEQRVADYTSIPRSVYTDPPVASVGRSYADAIAAGIDAVTAQFDIENTARNTVDGGPGGLLSLTADRSTRTLIGAAAIGPHCDEWITEAVLAIRAQIPLDILVDLVHAFPTYAQSYEGPYQELLAAVG
jgi:pyruvate/2-oxoglutarate dehydrogenase complex dihydrolipoamide dehydrogenase (E3) component